MLLIILLEENGVLGRREFSKKPREFVMRAHILSVQNRATTPVVVLVYSTIIRFSELVKVYFVSTILRYNFYVVIGSRYML